MDRTVSVRVFSLVSTLDIDDYLDRLPLIKDRTAAKPEWDGYQGLLLDEQPFTFLYQSAQATTAFCAEARALRLRSPH